MWRDPEKNPQSKDDNQQKFNPEDMTPDLGFRETGPDPGHSSVSQVLSPLRDPRSTVNYTNKLLIQWVQKLLAIATYASLQHDLLLLEA